MRSTKLNSSHLVYLYTTGRLWTWEPHHDYDWNRIWALPRVLNSETFLLMQGNPDA